MNLVHKIRNIRGLTDDMLFVTKLPSPYVYKDMDKAVALIHEAKEKNWKVSVLGDYDVDGILSTYSLLYGLRKYGIKRLGFIIPNRFKDGYGVSDGIVERVLNSNCSLLITCDNGIAHTKQLKRIRDAGIKVIITDHHKVPDNYEMMDAVIDPYRPDDESEFKELCGAGVVLHLLRALETSKEDLMQIYPFTAIATICDAMPLLYDNRLIVNLGLRYMKYLRNRGLIGLILMAGINNVSCVTPYDIGYRIGPRINAKGRIDDATDVIRLFLTSDYQSLEEILTDIENTNVKRQQLTNEGYEAVHGLLKNVAKDKIIAVSKAGLHPGVIGIIASRLVDEYGLPAIVITNTSDTVLTGSARSIPGVNIYEEIGRHSEYLIGFGGHPGAAGLKLHVNNLAPFLVSTQDTYIQPIVTSYDMDYNCNDISLGDALELQDLEPFGEGNENPVFHDTQRIVKTKIYEKVIRLFTEQGTEIVIFNHLDEIKLSLIKAGCLDRYASESDYSYELEFLYTVSVNKFLGKESVRVTVQKVINLKGGMNNGK